MKKLISLLSAVLFMMVFAPMSTYAATVHKTSHTQHVAHTSHVKSKKTTKQTNKKSKKTKKKAAKKRTFNPIPVQGFSPYVIVGTMTVVKEPSWTEIASHGSDWLNYCLKNNDVVTWHDPAKR